MANKNTELFNRLAESEEYKTMKEVYSQVFGKKTHWVKMQQIPKNPEQLLEECKFIKKKDSKRIKKKIECVYRTLERTKKDKSPHQVKLGHNYLAFTFALIKEGKTVGYLVVFNVTKKTSSSFLKILNKHLHTLILKLQNDLELARLYETIQPRTAALSTIHTIHRLMSATLNINQLLPRLARLTLQLMNVKECSIYLADNKKKFLRHIVTVSNKKQSRKKKRIRIGEGLVGKVAKSAVPILENNSLAIPLIEEDVLGVIVVHEKKNQKPLGYLDQDILTTLAEQAVVAIKNSTLHKQQEKLTLGSIKSLTALSGSRSVHTHISKLKYRNLVLAIAKELNLSKRKMQALKYASLLHDVGKIGIPEEILKKVGTLTSEEYNIVKEHPKRAASILKPLKVLEPAMPIILHHHEKYDGTGYPDGLKGKQIPMGARILSLVDAFEAMITKRSYRRCKSLKTALKEIKRNSGSQFDPKVVGAFLKIINKKKFNKEKLLK